MAKSVTIKVEGTEISVINIKGEEYLCLTDIAKRYGDENLIYNWIRNRNTVEFLGIWEQIFNPDFNPIEFERLRSEAGLNNFSLSPKKWVEATSAIGVVSKAGRYGSGTFAHKDITLEFCAWIDTRFKLYLVKEFQRLKTEESKREAEKLEWSVKRMLAKVNYRIHTDAIREHLVPPRIQNTKLENLYYASEADLLNLALFGVTAKQWRLENTEVKGNIRDYATSEQLLVLSNLENLNAEYIKLEFNKEERLQRLNEVAIHQMGLLVSQPVLSQLGAGEKKSLDKPDV